MKSWFLLTGALVAICAAAETGSGLRFANVTSQAGIRFVHHSGAAGKKYLPESLGSG